MVPAVSRLSKTVSVSYYGNVTLSLIITDAVNPSQTKAIESNLGLSLTKEGFESTLPLPLGHGQIADRREADCDGFSTHAAISDSGLQTTFVYPSDRLSKSR